MAHTMPFAATVVAATVIEQYGTVAFSAALGDKSRPGAVSRGLLDFLHTVFAENGGGFFDNGQDGNLAENLLYALDAKQIMHIVAADAMHHTKAERKTDPWLPPPSTEWWCPQMYTPPTVADPYAILVPSEYRRDVQLPHLFRFLGLEWADSLTYKDKEESLVQATLALQLAEAAGLLQ